MNTQAESNTISGSHAVIESLIHEGVDTIFGYPGGTIMPVYDALFDYRDQINHILVRHEQGAIHAAQGYARVSGKTGVCVVTSGPGATNTITGLADALMDSTPVVVISGQVSSTLLGTDAFQETNFVSMTQSVTKWNCQVKRAEDIGAALSRAFYIANSGRPGPVVVDITKDAQLSMCDFKYAITEAISSYNPNPTIKENKIKDAAKLINKAHKPMVLLGQGVILGDATDEFREFIEKADLPVASTLLGLSALPSAHTNYVGMLGMHGNYGPNVKNPDCDLLIAVGMRFDDRVTSDTKYFGKNAKIIHLEIDPSEINKIIPTDVAIVGNVKETLPMLTAHIETMEREEWKKEFALCHDKEFKEVIKEAIHPQEGPIRMGEVVNAITHAYNHEAVLVTDVGQQQMMASRYFQFTRPRSLVTSGGLGTMGFGLPAAIGAKMGAPDRDVCLMVGDGGLQMTIQELGTIFQSKIGVKIILLNNSFLGMVRQWQELFFDSRYSFTEMTNPDFGLIAAANQIPYLKIEDRQHLADAIATMQNTEGAFLLEVVVRQEENVFPMVPTGHPVYEVMLKQ